MTIHRMLGSAAILATLCVTLVAQQQAPSGYHRVTCVKVKPGRTAEFRALISGDISKVEHSEVDSGTISGWLLLRTMVPAGSDASCDYVFVAFYPGLPPAPMSDEETKAVIEKAGIGKTLSEWQQEHTDNGYQVSNNITRYVTLVGAAKKGDYLVFNSMSVSDLSAWIDWEKKNWQPFAQALVKNGILSAWAINEQVFPHGAKVQSQASSVDVYPSWEAAMHGFGGKKVTDLWNSVHPDLKFADANAQAAKLRTIDAATLYKVEEAIFPAK
jgi:hypothetical protein